MTSGMQKELARNIQLSLLGLALLRLMTSPVTFR